jgi:hypothetical protein
MLLKTLGSSEHAEPPTIPPGQKGYRAENYCIEPKWLSERHSGLEEK